MVEKADIAAGKRDVADAISGLGLVAAPSISAGAGGPVEARLVVLDDLGSRPGIGLAEMEVIETYFADLIDEALGLAR